MKAAGISLAHPTPTALLYARYADTVLSAFQHNPDYHLAILSENIGNYHSVIGNLEQSRYIFECYTQLCKTLLEKTPNNPEFKNVLAISCSKLGSTHSALSNLEQALIFFEQYNQLEKELHYDSPQDDEFKNDLALSYLWLGWFYEDKLQDLNQAKAYYRLSHRLLLELVNSRPAYAAFKRDLDWVNDKLPGE